MVPDPAQERVACCDHAAGENYLCRFGGVEHIHAHKCKGFCGSFGDLTRQFVARVGVLVDVLGGEGALFVKDGLEGRFAACLDCLDGSCGG